MLVIEYSQARPTHFYVSPTVKRGQDLVPGRKLWITPGQNFVTDPEEVAFLKKSKAFQASIAAPNGVKVEEFADAAVAKDADPAAKANPYLAIKDEKMKRLVAECLDSRQLRAIAEVEDRAVIQAAIAAQLESLRKGDEGGK